jgi:hypothetical protein
VYTPKNHYFESRSDPSKVPLQIVQIEALAFLNHMIDDMADDPGLKEAAAAFGALEQADNTFLSWLWSWYARHSARLLISIKRLSCPYSYNHNAP